MVLLELRFPIKELGMTGADSGMTGFSTPSYFSLLIGEHINLPIGIYVVF